MRVTLDPGDREILLGRLGLPDDSPNISDADLIRTSVDRLLFATASSATPPAAPREAVRDGHALIAAAVADERIPRSRADHYAQRYAEDPEGTTKLLERLAPGSARFSNEPVPARTLPGDSSYPTAWLPEIHGGRRERVHGGD